MASIVPCTRGSLAGRNPSAGMRSRLASSAGLLYACVNVFCFLSNPCSRTSRWMRSASARSRGRLWRASSSGAVNSSTMRAKRSMATHAIIFE